MKKCSRLSVIVLFLLLTSACSLITNNCDAILSQKLFIASSPQLTMKQAEASFKQLKHCGFVDDGDIELLNTGIFLLPLIQEMEGKKYVTYQQLYSKLLSFKKQPMYEEMKEILLVKKQLERFPATVENWSEIHSLLSYNKPNKTIVEAWDDFIAKQDAPTEQYSNLFKDAGNIDYEDLLQKSVAVKKPLLLFFTGHACVNSSRMMDFIKEDSILANTLINDFFFVTLYVDDRMKLPENASHYSRDGKRELEYIGQKHADLQLSEFKKNSQPYFVIVDENGVVVKELVHAKNKKIFTEFLSLEK